MKRLFIAALIFCFAASVAAIEPGSSLNPADVAAQMQSVLPAKIPVPEKKADFQILIFFDAFSPDSKQILQMADNLPDFFPDKKISVNAFAKNTKSAVSDTFSVFFHHFKPEYLSIYADNEKNAAFNRFCTGEVLIPFAVIAVDGKVRWKGTPADLENTLANMISGSFSYQKLVRINMLRSDLQSAIQAGLPEVILRSADQILAVDPADTIAIQAKLYVLNGNQRPDLANAFVEDCVKKSPRDVRLRLLLLNTMGENGNRQGFQNAFKAALTDFNKDSGALLRILGFSFQNAPFGWIPLKEAADAAQIACKVGSGRIGRREAFQLEISARIAYLTGNLEQAVQLQTRAAEYPDGNAAAMLQYFQSALELHKK